MRSIIGQNIRKIREARDLTQENLAHEIDVSKGTISKIEAGTYNTSMKRFEAIAEALEVHVSEIFKLPKEYKNLDDNPQANYGGLTKKDLDEAGEKVILALSEDNKVVLDIIVSLLRNNNSKFGS